VTVATSEPYDTGWVAEIESHTRRRVKLVLANPEDVARYATEFYALARSVRQAQKTGEASATASFEQLVELGKANKQLDANDQGVVQVVDWLCSTPSTSVPATSTWSRGARWERSAFASTACCTPSTRCR